MKDEEPLLQSLRRQAAEHKTVRDFVKTIYDFHGKTSHNETLVIGCLMRAFDLGFLQVKDVAGAECVGNKAYTDDEVDRKILPAIRASLEKSAIEPGSR